MKKSILLIPTDLAGRKQLLKELKERLANLEKNKTAENEADISQLRDFIAILNQNIELHEKDVKDSSIFSTN